MNETDIQLFFRYLEEITTLLQQIKENTERRPL